MRKLVRPIYADRSGEQGAGSHNGELIGNAIVLVDAMQSQLQATQPRPGLSVCHRVRT